MKERDIQNRHPDAYERFMATQMLNRFTSPDWKLRQFLKELEDLIYHYKKL